MDLDSILRAFTTSAKTWVAGKYPPEEPLFDQLSLGPLLLSNCPSPRLFKVKIIPKSHMRPTPKSINADPTLYQDRWYLTPDAEEMVRCALVPSLSLSSLRSGEDSDSYLAWESFLSAIKGRAASLFLRFLVPGYHSALIPRSTRNIDLMICSQGGLNWLNLTGPPQGYPLVPRSQVATCVRTTEFFFANIGRYSQVTGR
ncbi:hypothetical protein ASPCAL11056 [Aspergillus calidoustus]|uniref:Uncharacterized protein n=1 Tax=Aspergillus calidoustus TaxID=454130 RepID=A0A0U5GBC2_ASPCI|nr:hypothetical protein ASPCAL11056 [Aspergillus calidoustus]